MVKKHTAKDFIFIMQSQKYALVICWNIEFEVALIWIWWTHWAALKQNSYVSLDGSSKLDISELPPTAKSVHLNVCEHVSACLFSLEVDKVCWYNFKNTFNQKVIIEGGKNTVFSEIVLVSCCASLTGPWFVLHSWINTDCGSFLFSFFYFHTKAINLKLLCWNCS